MQNKITAREVLASGAALFGVDGASGRGADGGTKLAQAIGGTAQNRISGMLKGGYWREIWADEDADFGLRLLQSTGLTRGN